MSDVLGMLRASNISSADEGRVRPEMMARVEEHRLRIEAELAAGADADDAATFLPGEEGKPGRKEKHVGMTEPMLRAFLETSHELGLTLAEALETARPRGGVFMVHVKGPSALAEIERAGAELAAQAERLPIRRAQYIRVVDEARQALAQRKGAYEANPAKRREARQEKAGGPALLVSGSSRRGAFRLLASRASGRYPALYSALMAAEGAEMKRLRSVPLSPEAEGQLRALLAQGGAEGLDGFQLKRLAPRMPQNGKAADTVAQAAPAGEAEGEAPLAAA